MAWFHSAPRLSAAGTAAAHVCGDGRRRHELRSFRDWLKAADRHVPTIWVLDRAYHDKGRALHPLLRWPRMPQLSAQFIRTVRNHLFSRKTIGMLLAAFTAAMTAYL